MMNFNIRMDDEIDFLPILPMNENEEEGVQSRVVKAREVRVVRNNKPVLHVKQVSDSAHPERNQTKIFKAKKIEEDEEIEEDL